MNSTDSILIIQKNIASQALQSVSSNVQTAMVALENVLTYLQGYETTDFMNSIEKAKEMACIIGIEPNIANNRRPTPTRQYRTSFEAFKKYFLLHILGVATESTNERFNAIKEYDDLFSFLYGFKYFESNKESGKLYESGNRLASALTHNESVDIDAADLYREFPIIVTLIKNRKSTHAIDILNLVWKIWCQT